MSDTILQASLLQQCPVQNQVIPQGGPKAIPVILDFANGGSPIIPPDAITLDYSNVQALGRFDLLQGFFVDNSNNGSALTITIEGTAHRIIIPATSQAWMPALCMNPVKVSFQSAGGVAVKVYLLNFPVAPAVWGV